MPGVSGRQKPLEECRDVTDYVTTHDFRLVTWVVMAFFFVYGIGKGCLSSVGSGGRAFRVGVCVRHDSHE